MIFLRQENYIIFHYRNSELFFIANYKLQRFSIALNVSWWYFSSWINWISHYELVSRFQSAVTHLAWMCMFISTNTIKVQLRDLSKLQFSPIKMKKNRSLKYVMPKQHCKSVYRYEIILSKNCFYSQLIEPNY